MHANEMLKQFLREVIDRSTALAHQAVDDNDRSTLKVAMAFKEKAERKLYDIDSVYQAEVDEHWQKPTPIASASAS